MQLLGKMLGDPNKKEIKAMQQTVNKIKAFEADGEKWSDEQRAAKTVEFRAQLDLYLKGGLVLEDQLLQIFREVLDAVEPLAAKCSDAQLREAITEPRKVIERRRDPEKMLRDNLQDTLSECFEQAYENLNTIFNKRRATAAMDRAEETQDWPDDAKDPEKATLSLLKTIEPTLEEMEDDYPHEAFEKAWREFERPRNSAWGKDDGAYERLGQIVRRL